MDFYEEWGCDPIHSWIMCPLGLPCPGFCILWHCPWLTQEARPTKDEDRFKDSLTALEQWPGQGSGKFWAWSNTEYYCLISQLWLRHSGKKIQLDIPSGTQPYDIQKGRCKVVSATMWSTGSHSLSKNKNGQGNAALSHILNESNKSCDVFKRQKKKKSVRTCWIENLIYIIYPLKSHIRQLWRDETRNLMETALHYLP